MLTDGVKNEEKEDQVKVLDIAEMIAIELEVTLRLKPRLPDFQTSILSYSHVQNCGAIQTCAVHN